MGLDKHYLLTNSRGVFTAGTDRITIIGQPKGCDIKLPNPTPYCDEVFAKIVPNQEGDGWHLVKVTKHWPVTVNGAEIRFVHYLKDGDVIDFPNVNFRFNVREGRQEMPSVVNIHKNGKLLWGLVVAIVVISVIIGYRIYDSGREKITAGMQQEIEASLFTTRVDSLRLMAGDSVVDSYAYVACPVGTAFLTTDSLIVTARHCIQPWLNSIKPEEYAQIPTSTDWAVAKALFAETENQLEDSSRYRIISYMTLTDEQGNSFQIDSDQFAVNYDFDDIVELGTYASAQYWRSISHRYNNQDMMLGDITVAKYHKGGNIPLASSADLKRLLPKRGVNLTFFGHPESGVNGNQLDRSADELRLPLKDMECAPGHIFMLAHGGQLTPGFSGGPVIVRDGMEFKAVGVISVIDDKNGQRSYSVPTSEIFTLKP